MMVVNFSVRPMPNSSFTPVMTISAMPISSVPPTLEVSAALATARYFCQERKERPQVTKSPAQPAAGLAQRRRGAFSISRAKAPSAAMRPAATRARAKPVSFSRHRAASARALGHSAFFSLI